MGGAWGVGEGGGEVEGGVGGCEEGRGGGGEEERGSGGQEREVDGRVGHRVGWVGWEVGEGESCFLFLSSSAVRGSSSRRNVERTRN